MKNEDKSAIFGALFLLVVCVGGYIVMPSIMLWLGQFSTILAGLAAALFILLPFIVLWFRARWQRNKAEE